MNTRDDRAGHWIHTAFRMIAQDIGFTRLFAIEAIAGVIAE